MKRDSSHNATNQPLYGVIELCKENKTKTRSPVCFEQESHTHGCTRGEGGSLAPLGTAKKNQKTSKKPRCGCSFFHTSKGGIGQVVASLPLAVAPSRAIDRHRLPPLGVVKDMRVDTKQKKKKHTTPISRCFSPHVHGKAVLFFGRRS